MKYIQEPKIQTFLTLKIRTFARNQLTVLYRAHYIFNLKILIFTQKSPYFSPLTVFASTWRLLKKGLIQEYLTILHNQGKFNGQISLWPIVKLWNVNFVTILQSHSAIFFRLFRPSSYYVILNSNFVTMTYSCQKSRNFQKSVPFPSYLEHR